MRWNGVSRCELVESSMETETATLSEFPNGGKVIVEQILVSEEISKSKRADYENDSLGSEYMRTFTLPCLGNFAVGCLRTPYSPTVFTAKYFQRFKILKYLQNEVCLRFDLFTHYICRFSSDFYRINNVFKYKISCSSLSKSFCLSTPVKPNHGVP